MKKKLLINKILRGLMFLTVAADLYMLATSNEYFFYGLFLIPIIWLVDKDVNPESYQDSNHQQVTNTNNKLVNDYEVDYMMYIDGEFVERDIRSSGS